MQVFFSFFAFFVYLQNGATLHFFGTGHTQRLLVFDLKSAAWYCLTEDELDEILSCESEPMLRSYLAGLFRATACLWKFVMPIDARGVFQTKVFHPAKVSSKLQSHLGMTLQ